LELDRAVSLEEHYHLNQGLRDLLYADAKHPDNSLLRLPGTFNRKGRPTGVIWKRDVSKVWKPADLLRIPAIRDTRVVRDTKAVGDGTYEKANLEHLPPYARRVSKMPVDEAVGKYGSRHSAVYGVAQRLIKLGLTRDEIHTAMEEFEAGLEKEQDENGYDMHRDIDRCIARHPTLEEVIKTEDDDEPAWTPVSDEEYAQSQEEDLRDKAMKKVRDWDITDLAKQIRAHRSFLPPPDEASVLFSDAMAEETQEIRYLVDGLASVGDNVSITGQFKTGKTLFICNLVHSLCEGDKFLGQFEVDDLDDCTVGLWSCEMTKNVLQDRYLKPLGFTEGAGTRLYMFHGRGYGVNLLDEVGKTWAIKWLRERDVSVWVIDSFARICAMAGVEGNDNDQVLRLLKTLDEIKRAAGVSELFLIAHTGRSEFAKDRARGATVFDDWADARWVLTRDGDVRFLKVEGRDVELPETSLMFDQDTKRLTLGGSKDQSLKNDGVQAVVAIVAQNAGVGKTALAKLIKERKIRGYSQAADINELIAEAEQLGFIKGERVVGARGGKIGYNVVPDGETITIDFTGIKEHQRKRRG
jgi:hypothetical protein